MSLKILNDFAQSFRKTGEEMAKKRPKYPKIFKSHSSSLISQKRAIKNHNENSQTFIAKKERNSRIDVTSYKWPPDNIAIS